MEQLLIAVVTSFIGGIVAMAVTQLARAFFPRLEGWFRANWRGTLAFSAIAVLEFAALVFAAGTAAGIAELVDQYSAAEVPFWAIILAAIAGGGVYTLQRASFPRRDREWAAGATKRSSDGTAEDARQRRIIEHDGVLWQEIGVIDLSNPFRRLGAGGPLCPKDRVKLGYEDPLTMGRVSVAEDDHRIGGVAGGILYCPLCGEKYHFKTGVNPAIGKSVREARKETESILEAQRQQPPRWPSTRA